jgi:acetaldehyde dehydrogenase (acetylating)
MLYINSLIDVIKSKTTDKDVKKTIRKINVGILGTGKIGTDLLVKVLRSPYLECVMFAGRNYDSEGMQFAAKLDVPLSDQGIVAFTQTGLGCDLVFDATTAACHVEHALILQGLGILAIDMTPSQIGECCVPAIGLDEVYENDNISMISCGGQASIPLAYVLSKTIPGIEKIEVVSRVSSESIGPGTLANIDEYYRNTKSGLAKYTDVKEFDVDLIVDNINTTTKMFTNITAHVRDESKIDMHKVIKEIHQMIGQIQTYVPGYHLEVVPFASAGQVTLVISVEGAGDYLPKFAGNLDIINCAALAVAEEFAKAKNGLVGYKYGMGAKSSIAKFAEAQAC